MNNNTAAPASKSDPLGYDVYARTLWQRIHAAVNKDQPSGRLGDDPLVVGIFGEWGAGKSHLLKLVQAQALAHQKEQQTQRENDEGFELTVPVFFQPWKYEHEEHLHVPLVMHTIGALKDALKEEAGLLTAFKDLAGTAEKNASKVTQVVQTSAKVTQHVYRIVQMVAGSLSFAGVKVELPDEPLEWLSEIADGSTKVKEQLEAHEKKRKQDKAAHAAQGPKFSADGLYFYRIHELLSSLTRPGKNAWVKTEVGDGNLSPNTRINFIIFIDDLDRCLPEKAVQTLELIKTVFNLESFAFVLALDDEVIERGIGHRYKEYKLQDKKPEMPITGFEYLEKIVHLPFRLPGLTKEQARNFLIRYEQDTAQTDSAFWFSEPETPPQDQGAKGLRRQDDRVSFKPVDLQDLVLASFDAYVPRKLVRVVELMRQVMQVTHQIHGKTITSTGQVLDIRVVLAVLMLQLFQPELYRLMRRRVDVFPALYGGFVRKELQYPIADIDLWRWVDQFGKGTSKAGQSQVMDALNPYEAAVQRIGEIAQDNDKADAQYVRLPLVTQLVEHRAVQRHAFNPLRMVQELVRLLQPSTAAGHTARSSLGEFVQYFQLLAAKDSAGEASTFSPQDPRPRFAVSPITRLVQDLTGPRAEAYENLAERHEFPAGQVLDESSVSALVKALQAWIESGQQVGQVPSAAPEAPEAPKTPEAVAANTERISLLGQAQLSKVVRRVQLLRALPYLAPYVAQDDGGQFWNLVKDCGIVIPEEPNTPTPVLASLYLDVRSMLGQDDRFERRQSPTTDGQTLKPLYLLRERWKDNTEKEEPIPGFVLIPKGTYAVGNPLTSEDQYTLLHDIYMSRMPVTVDQFGAFITDGGYGENENDSRAKTYWDDEGWARQYSSARHLFSAPGNHGSIMWLSQRTSDLRHRPWRWAEQQRIGNRPVTGVNWYEARAYARWLNEKLNEQIQSSLHSLKYELRLPNEREWEIAARACKAVHWMATDNDFKNFEFRANILQTEINDTNVPGCFAPNELGLLDMAGNVSEWQNNLWTDFPSYYDTPDNVAYAKVAIAVKGGGCGGDPPNATCWWRQHVHASHDSEVFGFRVMLAPTKAES